ncbi:MAG: MarR family transcriptional regulator [Devosia sp.]
MMRSDLPLIVTHEVRDRCLCLHLQRAARAIGRRFDEALRPVGLTHGQYSLLVSLNRPEPPKIGDVAYLLAMDRTTLTANLKPLERRGLLTVSKVDEDKRSRRLALTDAGRDILVEAVPIWRVAHDDIDRLLGGGDDDALKKDLLALSFGS